MKNKALILKIIVMLVITLIGTCFSKYVKAEERDDLSDFVIKNGVLTKYKGSSKVVIIPDGVKKIGGGETLRKNGLNQNNTITKVIIPDSVTEIGVNAFYMCSSLSEINIPESVTTIKQMAFGGCNNLINIHIPESVTTIESKMTFFDTPWLNAKEAESDLVIVNNILLSGYNAKGEVTVPEGVTKLAGLSMPSAITKIYLPETLVEIGNSAFAGCKRLREVYMNNNVKIIGDCAFEKCKSLEVLQLSNKLTEIDDIFFGIRFKKLKELEIPASVTKIFEDTFVNIDKTKILVHKGSYAHKYVKENNIKHKVLDSNGEIQNPNKYTVIKAKKGDTLWKLSKKYLGKGNRFKEIMQLNNLKKSTIYVGQKFKIPAK